MSLITPVKRLLRPSGRTARSRRELFDTPLSGEEIHRFRSWLTQAGSILQSNSVKTALVKGDAITDFWSESGTAGYTGEFADITVTRRAGTELLFWTMIAVDDVVSDNGSGTSFLYRNLYAFRDSTQIYRFGENLPIIGYYINTNIPKDSDGDQLVTHAGCFRSFHYVDAAEVSGSKAYKFHYKDNSPSGNNFASQTDAGVLIYYIFLMERKR